MARQQHGGTQLGRFLRARRTQMSPKEAGIEVGPRLRRTPGLRREELAALAGVSVDYYTRLEQGKEHRPSPGVIDAIATALHLDEAEQEHLFGLVTRAANMTPPQRKALSNPAPAPGIELMLECLRPYPARLLSRTTDVLACNPGGLRTLPGIESWPAGRRNIARYLLLHPLARDVVADWDVVTGCCVARLRALAGIEPDAPDLNRLIDELTAESPDFARLWERYEVLPFTEATKTLHHPEVGRITLSFQSLQIEGTPGHHLVTYYAEPGTPDHDAIMLLDRDDTDRPHQAAARVSAAPLGLHG
jgi:transcriptional regulator with XRE-family HTH domain